MANNNLSLLSNSTVTALSVNESKVIDDLKKNYGDNFADNAKMCLMCDKSNNATHIIKCKAIFNAIYTYNTNCTELKKQQKARTAFSNATGINATDITRYMSIYSLRSLWMEKATVCNSAKNDLQKEKLIDCYMSKYDYSKLVEIAKLREDEKLYLLDECEDTLYMYTKSQLLFMLEPYKMEIAPLNGRDNEFKARKQWIDENKKIKDYGKKEDENNDNSGNDNSGNDNSGNDNSGNDNSGNDNSGTDNSGTDNSGTDNSGNDNSGNDNSGNDNSGNDNSELNIMDMSESKRIDLIKELFDSLLIDDMKSVIEELTDRYTLWSSDLSEDDDLLIDDEDGEKE